MKKYSSFPYSHYFFIIYFYPLKDRQQTSVHFLLSVTVENEQKDVCCPPVGRIFQRHKSDINNTAVNWSPKGERVLLMSLLFLA